jgi:hypothetical protein
MKLLLVAIAAEFVVFTAIAPNFLTSGNLFEITFDGQSSLIGPAIEGLPVSKKCVARRCPSSSASRNRSNT